LVVVVRVIDQDNLLMVVVEMTLILQTLLQLPIYTERLVVEEDITTACHGLSNQTFSHGLPESDHLTEDLGEDVVLMTLLQDHKLKE
tara:strand:+ start:40 stop:300 length:261 start_codon:yes stop_codon:yes gene_type:complete